MLKKFLNRLLTRAAQKRQSRDREKAVPGQPFQFSE